MNVIRVIHANSRNSWITITLPLLHLSVEQEDKQILQLFSSGLEDGDRFQFSKSNGFRALDHSIGLDSKRAF